MGILESVHTATKIAEASARIVEKINTPRSCIIEFWNHTDFTVRVRGSSHAHGGFIEPPSIEVPPQTTDIFGSQSDAFSIATGTEGFVTYDIGDINTSAVLRWNNPFVGGNGCSGRVEGEKGFAFEMKAICGGGNNAHMKYELRLVRDIRFVRPPDYYWVRLEGYAFDPNHNWFAGDPDAAGNLFPHEAVPLHSWWSSSREENFATTNPAYTQPVKREFSPNYNWYRLEGYVISPQIGQPEGTVPLHSWWSSSREDNFATANPGYTSPLQERISPDYAEYRLEGYLFSPRLPQPEHTVPVHSWYSSSRNDNFITTDPNFRP